MIDNLTVLVSHGLLAYILFRAVVLNRKLPWFAAQSRYDDASAADGADDSTDATGEPTPSNRTRRRQRPTRGSNRFQPRFRNNPSA